MEKLKNEVTSNEYWLKYYFANAESFRTTFKECTLT